MLVATLAESEAQLVSHVAAWAALADQLRLPYCQPGWMLAWWRRAAPAGALLRVVLVHDGDRLVAVAPFFAERAGAGLTRLRLLAAGPSVRLDVVAAPDAERAAVARLVAERLAATLPAPALVAFEGVPATSAWPRALAAAWPPRGARLAREATMPAPTISLEGWSGVDDWLAARSPNFRQQMRKFRRRLERAGGRLHVAETPEDVGRGVDALVELHTARWQWRGGTRALTAGVAEMARDAARELAPDGRVRLVLAEADGRVVAVQYLVCAGGEVGAWLQGFDEAHADSRPAQTALVESVADAIARGDVRYDLGSGGQPFKYRFADGEDLLAWEVLVPRGRRYPLARALLAARGLRREAGRRLPAPAKARLRAAAGAAAALRRDGSRP